jgi:alkylation response protein AidB-like acyl-CoA dehydrogenase
MMGMTAPREYGGGGNDEVSHVLTLMEISRGSASVGGVLAWNNALYCFPLVKYGTEEQKRKYLAPCARGEKIGSFAVIGHAFYGRNRFVAVADEPFGVVQGEGNFFPCGISFGVVPEVALEGNRRGALIVDLERGEGLRREGPIERGGIFFSGIEEVIFENRQLEGDDFLDGGDDGSVHAHAALQEAWTAVGALAAGIGEGALADALDSLRREKERASISQSVEWKVADMAVETEAARLFVLKAAWLKDRGRIYEKEAASAKIFAAGAAVKAASESLDILGDRNPERRPLMEKRLRDAKMCQIYYGTLEGAGYVVADHVIGLSRTAGF